MNQKFENGDVMRAVTNWVRAIGADYDYSPWHRLLEIGSIAASLALLCVMGWRLGYAVVDSFDLLGVAALLSSALLGYMAADLVSGVVHWLADRFGTPETPVLGEAFIRPFREHHDDPKDITRHDFVEVNGNNCLVLLMFLVPVFWMMPAELGLSWMAMGGFCFAFPVAIFMTNQFHKWAHMDQVPAPVAWLHRHGLILSPESHDRHHSAPFDTDYCITSGWLNPLLERLRLFARIEQFLRPHAAQESRPEAMGRASSSGSKTGR